MWKLSLNHDFPKKEKINKWIEAWSNPQAIHVYILYYFVLIDFIVNVYDYLV